MTTLCTLSPRRRLRLERFLLGLLAALLLSPLSAPAQENVGEETPLVSDPEALEIPTQWLEIPGNRQANLAPAAAPLGNLIYAFLVDQENHILFQTFDPAADRWSMAESWVEVPGGLLTSASVALASTGDRLYVFAVRKSDQQVFFTDKMAGGPFEGWGSWRMLQAGPKAIAVAAAARPDGGISVFLTSTKNKLYHTGDPLPFVSWEQVPGGVSTQMAPGAAWDAATDTLYLLVRRSKSEVALLSRQGDAWSAPCKVPDAGTATAVAPGIYQGQLFLFSVTDDRLWAQAYGGACERWTGRAEVPGAVRTNGAPALSALPADFSPPFMLVAKGIRSKKVYYRFFAQDDVVPEVTTRGHFNLSNGKLRSKTHTRYDYGLAGRIPGITPGTVCPENLAIAVHGWTNPPKDGQEKFLRAQASLRRLGYTGPVIGFSWDSSTEGCPIDVPFLPDETCGFEEGKDIAAGNGPKLAAFLGDFKTACPCTAIHLMAHSLGARVTLDGLQALSEDTSLRWSQLGGVRIDDVHLLGAAVNDESPQLDKEFGESIQNEVVSLFNYKSSEDGDLKWYARKEGEGALGRKGIEDESLAPSNYQDLEVEDLVGSEHKAYWGKRDAAGAVTSTGAMSRVFERFASRSLQCLGGLYPTDCAAIDGWAWNHARPARAATVRVFVDGGLLFEGPANVYREDLERNRIGNGKHAFSVPIPLSLKDGHPHTVTARFGDTPLELDASPQTFQCSLEGFLDEASCGESLLGPSLVVRGWARDPSQAGFRANVLILINGKLVTVPADNFREDLVAAGKDDGKHGFRYSVPLCTGSTSNPFGCQAAEQNIEVRAGIEGSNFELFQSPRTFFCKQPPRSGGPDGPGL